MDTVATKMLQFVVHMVTTEL